MLTAPVLDIINPGHGKYCFIMSRPAVPKALSCASTTLILIFFRRLAECFADDTPWETLALENPNGHTFELKRFEKWAAAPAVINTKYKQQAAHFASQYAWRNTLSCFPTLQPPDYNVITYHYHSGILHLASRDSIRLNELVGPEISMSDLFSFGFDTRLARSVGEWEENRTSIGLASAIAAVRGYLPAQAICASILQPSEGQISAAIIAEVMENEFEWQRNAVASGYVLSWKFAAHHPAEFEEALDTFRRGGGYNQHYISPLFKDTDPAAPLLQYSRSGLLQYSRKIDGALPWLNRHPLHKAAALGLTDDIEQLIDNKAVDIDAVDDLEETPLIKAAMAGSVAAVTLLMSRGADHRRRSPLTGAFPIHYLFLFPSDSLQSIGTLLVYGAIEWVEGSTKGTKSILNEKTKPDIPAFHFPFRWPASTPVGWAILANNSAAVEVLCKLGSSLDAIEEFFPTPIVRAWGWDAHSKQPDMLAALEHYESWIYSDLVDHMSPTVMVCENWFLGMCRMKGRERRARNRTLKLTEHTNALLKALVSVSGSSDAEIKARLQSTTGADNWRQYVNAPSLVNGRLPLAVAAARGRSDMVRLLIEYGAELNPPGGKRQHTALWAAIRAGHTRIIKLLLGAGARITGPEFLDEACRMAPLEAVTILLEATQKAGIGISSALHAATERNIYTSNSAGETASVTIATTLLSAGADPNVETEDGTPLLWAARCHATRLVDLLWMHGANPNWSGGSTNTNPLQESIESGSGHTSTSTMLLLANRADPNAVSGAPCATPLQAMAYYGSSAGVKLLLEYGARVNSSTVPQGRFGSPLQAASAKGDIETVGLLIQAGANLNAGGGLYGCALKAATVQGHSEIVSLLRKHGASLEKVRMPGSLHSGKVQAPMPPKI